jgi:hypothetical protein
MIVNDGSDRNVLTEDALSIVEHSCSGESGATSHINNSSNTESQQRPQISSKESKVVNRLRISVFLALFFASMVVSVIVYIITSNSQHHEFCVQYEGMSGQLIHAFNDIVTQKISVVGSLRVSLMAHALDNEQGWPFVTLSSFQQRAETVRRLSNIYYLGTYPVVEESVKRDWEKYVAAEAPAWM